MDVGYSCTTNNERSTVNSSAWWCWRFTWG